MNSVALISPHQYFLQYQFHLCSTEEGETPLDDKQKTWTPLSTLETHAIPTEEKLKGQDVLPGIE